MFEIELKSKPEPVITTVSPICTLEGVREEIVGSVLCGESGEVDHLNPEDTDHWFPGQTDHRNPEQIDHMHPEQTDH